MSFTNQSLIEDYLGEEGVDLLSDDLSSPSTEINRAIVEADDFILMHLLERYDESALQGASWVQRRATEIACYFLFLRRGQQPPTGLAETFLRIREDLEKIASSDRSLIPGASPREQQGPAISNYVVDDRRYAHRLRVDVIDSTNDYPERRSYIDPNIIP